MSRDKYAWKIQHLKVIPDAAAEKQKHIVKLKGGPGSGRDDDVNISKKSKKVKIKKQV